MQSNSFCPVCRMNGYGFQPLPSYYADNLAAHGWPHGLDNFETLNVPAYTCPKCLSNDRDRLYTLFLERVFSHLDKAQTYTFLEFAPAALFSRWVKSHPFISYRSCDLYMPEADDKADIHALPYADNTYDFILCSHILEHVEDPIKAVSELRRVLKPGGFAIIMAPILLSIDKTYENPAAVTPADRWRHFGQDDHVRIFSKSGFRDTLTRGGVALSEYPILEMVSEEQAAAYGINKRSVIYLGMKEAVSAAATTSVPEQKTEILGGTSETSGRPKVSVVIPAYNHEKYVVEAVESVLAQSYQNFELLIMDDGSTDTTPQILRRYADDPKVKLFLFEKNRGAAHSHNHGILESRGEYIALLNSDDVWEPNKLAEQVAFLDAHPEIAAVFTPASFIGEQSQPLADHQHHLGRIFDQPNRTRHEWLRFFFVRNALCHPSSLVRRECYEELGLYDPRFGNLPDYEMWIRLCLKHEIHVMPKPLIRFRIRDGEAQASAPSSAGSHRWRLEHKQLARRYLEIPSIADFNLIFPENAGNRFDDARLIPFYLADFIFSQNVNPHTRDFAFETLYDFMASDENRSLVEGIHGFQMKNFLNMTGGKPPN
ncbi:MULTISPECIES: glycosyltransferase [unclassified Rhizobium]|uniref:glycosyltransferase n=1 Tax=unclassified Rhizobium TaxID=2613769 RepID=UPI0037FE20DF